MFCCDTSEMEAVLLGKGKLTRVPDLRKLEVVKIGKHVGAVRANGHGNGRICLPLINGFLKHLETTFMEGFDALKKGN